MSLTSAWLPYFSGDTRQRGRDDFERGRVTLLAGEGGELARAAVVAPPGAGGSGKDQVLVTFRRDAGTATAACSCDTFRQGRYCRHIWAALLALEREGVQLEGDAQPASADLSGLGPAAPKARKRDAAVRPHRAAEPPWATRLSLLATSAWRPPVTSPLADPKQIIYAVNTALCAQYNALIVDVRSRPAMRGGWLRLKPFKISDDIVRELTDPVDREICGLLLGATWVDPYETADYSFDRTRRSTFRLPAGAWRAMMQRMIGSRRCVIDLPNGSVGPLAWDDGAGAAGQPWTLWMVGRHGDEGIIVTAEIRRGSERASVSAPQLILGGGDGLVFLDGKAAAFDDRDAFRWVQQFREDERRGRTAPPLVVPPRDVAKFLERLYLLADLPEIDLPADVAMTEQLVSPAAHLDLFNPGASGGGGGGAGGGGSGGKQLLAALWFEYGPHRIEPGQPGRFVAAAQSQVEGDDAALAAPDEALRGDVAAGRSPRRPAAVAEEAPPPAVSSAVPAGPGLMRRDLRFERQSVEMLAQLGFRTNPVAGDCAMLLPAKLMPHAVATLVSRGWVVRADKHLVRGAATPKLTIRSGVDWLELHGGVRFATHQGEEVVPLPQILAAARAGQTMIALGDGSQGMLPQQWLQQHGLLTAIAKVEGDHLLFRHSQAAMLDVLLDQQALVDVDQHFAQTRQRLREFDQIKPGDPPAGFHGELRHYQCEGLGWLHFLQWFGMGGILADDMGLGKTIQVLAMLQEGRSEERGVRSEKGGVRSQGPGVRSQETVDAAKPTDGSPWKQSPKRPSLVVAPRSVVFNWIDEAAKFTPSLRVVSYAGIERGNVLEDLSNVDVLVTSYGLLRRDVTKLREVDFEYVILDEAQAIKNPNSQVAKAARLVGGRHRLALTGTPVENHLGDLWSIFEFLNPGMLGSATRFGELIRGQRGGSRNGQGAAANNDELGLAAMDDAALAALPGAIPVKDAAPPADADAVPDDAADDDDDLDLTGPITLDDSRHLDIARSAAAALRPFILRRTKQQVLTELPDKTEQTIICEMEPAQRKVYDDLLKYYRSALLAKLDTPAAGPAAPALAGGGASGMPMMVLEALLRLRQAACHPGLIDENRQGEPSAKLEALLDNLAELIDEGHKALVFSQFTSMLAIVRKRLDETGLAYEYLDGKTQDRKARVHRFQSDPKCPVFLISLKAGGLGLNLTAADYVFILDPWWNPAVEQQAIDRAHRIGQTRHVFAYRLICADTVEQRIAELQVKKKKLADAIIGGQENLLRSLTRADLELLLS